MIVLGADDAAEDFVVVQEREDLLQLLVREAVPVRVHRELDDRDAGQSQASTPRCGFSPSARR